MTEPFATHDVLNQSPQFAGVNLYSSDSALKSALTREGGAAREADLLKLGARAGSADATEWARLANEVTPILRTHDAKGHRLDMVEFHPAYHALMDTSFAAGIHRLDDEKGANVVRAAKLYMAAQMEPGHCCPITMTNAAQCVLQRAGTFGEPWLKKARAEPYDRRFLPMQQKASITLGMGMTEKQGGSDVRANTTEAIPEAAVGAGQTYRITGHKWFMSAPMSDAFLILAQAKGGLTCFLLPRFTPEGRVNAIRFQRLKSKLGNRSNASSEVEFQNALAFAIGEEGEGTRVIIEMVTATRLDCIVASAALMRQSLAHAIHHAEHRTAFQKKLVDQPLMQQVLADLALDVEASVALAFRLARAFDNPTSERDNAWRRLMTPVVKYWVCKTAPPFVAEAMECLGGNGYVEDGPLARIYREVPVNSIWEGSGNIMALDILRVWRRESDLAGLLVEDLKASVASASTRAGFERMAALLKNDATVEANGRQIAEGLAELAAAILLQAHAPSDVAEAFIANRLGTAAQRTYGSYTSNARSIVDRASAKAG